MSVGDLIQARRTQLGLTLEQVGEYCGVGKSTVRKWEIGMIQNMRRDKIALLAEILQLDPVDLIVANQPSVISATGSPPDRLTDEERILIAAYRDALPEYQAVVMDILSNHKRRTDP